MNLNFNLHPAIDTNININKLSPEWVILIGVLLAGYGFYLYSNKEKKETNC